MNLDLEKEVVKKQIEILRFRNTCKAFEDGAKICVEETEDTLGIIWSNHGVEARLTVDFINQKYSYGCSLINSPEDVGNE